MQIGERLAEILGPKGWLTGADVAPWRRDWLDRYGEAPLGVARPSSTAEVSVAGGVILSLARMAAVGTPDPASASVEVEAGLVLAALHDAVEGSGLMFPLHLGAEGSAQIGGLIGTNAGGSQAFRYGMMSDLVLGLEVVLADGTVGDGMRAVQKDNAGYQLRRLFCGSEGTLGIVTRAVLRLSLAPRQRATALLALPDIAAAVAFGTRLRAEAGEFLTGLEFFSETGVELAGSPPAWAAASPPSTGSGPPTATRSCRCRFRRRRSSTCTARIARSARSTSRRLASTPGRTPSPRP